VISNTSTAIVDTKTSTENC